MAMNSDPTRSDPNFMMSLARGLEVLLAFEGQPSLTVAEAARITGLNRPSTGRCLYTLEQLGYVREQGGRFTLTTRLLPLAAGFLMSTPLASTSQALVNALRDRLEETVSVAALDDRRSEEHTSELQSLMRLSYAVFCLKKKKQV